MKQSSIRISAVGVSGWLNVDYLQNTGNVGLAVTMDSGSTITVDVQYTLDDPGPAGDRIPLSVSQTTTNISVNDPNHGLSVGDSVRLMGIGGGIADGDYPVGSVTDANNYVLTSTVSQTASGTGSGKLRRFRVFPHGTLKALSARAAGALGLPARMVRLNCTAHTAGAAELVVLQGTGS